MNKVGIYLTFNGNTEEAFEHYRSVFGGAFTEFQRMNEIPADDPSTPPLPETEQQMVMHVALPILDGTLLMGTDVLPSMGQEHVLGNNTTISLEFDQLDEAQRVFSGLTADATEVMELQPMFWGAHWGTLCDRFGIRWMFNVPAVSESNDGTDAPGA